MVTENLQSGPVEQQKLSSEWHDFYSDNTAVESSTLSGQPTIVLKTTVEAMPKSPESARRFAIFKNLGRLAVGLFRPHPKVPPEWDLKDGESYDFPSDSLDSTIEPMTVDASILDDPDDIDASFSTDLLDSELISETKTELLPDALAPKAELAPSDVPAFFSAAKELEARKRTRFESQRAQELIERELNKKLTTIDHLEEAILTEAPGISKRELEYHARFEPSVSATSVLETPTPKGVIPETISEPSVKPSDIEPLSVEIPVYDLKGLPFTFLSTAVDFKRGDDPNKRGSKTYRAVLENPAVWTETRAEAEASAGFGTLGPDARGGTISCSYTNSETNPNSRVGSHGDGYLVYGFESIRPDSLTSIHLRDSGSHTADGRGMPELGRSAESAIKNLELSPDVSHNEVVLRRYDESGEPLRPSYIITVDNNITETMLKHANFFNIPILNIDRKVYDEKLNLKASDALRNITPDSSYDQFVAALNAIRHAPQFSNQFAPRDSYGRSDDADAIIARRQYYPAGDLHEKWSEFEQLEFEKRLKLIESELGDLVDTYETANATNEKCSFNSERFEKFSISAFDAESDEDEYLFFDSPRPAAPDVCSHVSVNILPKNGEQELRLSLYDGADSAPYLRLKPLFERYRAAFRANMKLKKS